MGISAAMTSATPALRRDGEETSDQVLVGRVRAGDDRAFEQLYQRYHRRIASYVQGMVKDHARAEDITQDVFMSALRRMRETDRTIAFKPWIYEIAKNACIDQFRRSRRAEEVSMDADDSLGSADYGRLVSSTPTPDVAVDHKQQIDHLRGAFGGLSETHHEILVMRELEGLSYREIGEKLGMTRPAVESTLFRARRRLTEEYDELVTGERCVRVQQIVTAAGGSALGARDRRRVARHVSYCQPCLRHARATGLDSAALVHKPVRAKIAAFLPLPAFLKERWGAPSSDTSATLAQWSMHASSFDPSVVSGWGKAAATAATIAIAGVGAGVATNPPDSIGAGLGGGSLLESIDGPSGASDGSRAERSASRDSSRGSSSAAGDRRDRDAASRGDARSLPGDTAIRRDAAGSRDGARGSRGSDARGGDSGARNDAGGGTTAVASKPSGGSGPAGSGDAAKGDRAPSLTSSLPSIGAPSGTGGPGTGSQPSAELPDLSSVGTGATTGTTGGSADKSDAVRDVVKKVDGAVGGLVGGE